MSSVEESSEDILYLPGVVYESMFRYEFHCEEKTLYAYYTDGQLSYQDKEVEGEDMLVIEIIQDRTEAPDASVTSLVLEKGADLWVKTDEFLKAAEALLSE
ncbi:MAG: hypothetical protein IKE21_09675 [Erysipelotrichaceae bacterium]|nr:hypothetical protein [Erysipelotrichaceae bacterium]